MSEQASFISKENQSVNCIWFISVLGYNTQEADTQPFQEYRQKNGPKLRRHRQKQSPLSSHADRLALLYEGVNIISINS